MIRFEHPFAFILLLAIPLFYLLRTFKIFSPLTISFTISDWNGNSFKRKYILIEIVHAFLTILYITAFSAAVIATASPVLSQQEKIYTSRGSEIIFVIDTSPSMAALDMVIDNKIQNRFFSARAQIESFTAKMPNTAVGLTALASQAAFLIPPTTDHSTFLERLFSLSIGEFGDGSAIGEGLATAAYHLVNSSAPKKTIVLLTDGENNAGSIHPHTAARIIADNNIMLYVIGIGSRGSVPIEYTDSVTGKVFSGFLDSQFDETVLRRIAEEGGGIYFYAENPELLASAFDGISIREQTAHSFYYKPNDTPLHDIFLITAIICAATAWIIRRLLLRESL